MLELTKHIKRVSFELSNLCNLAAIHPQCPASKVKVPIFLDELIIFEVLHDLEAWGFKGTVAWYIYSEPLIDPRLIYFANIVRDLFDKAVHQRIVTNGVYLDQILLDELINAGITYFKIDAYSDGVLKRVKGLKPKKAIEKFKITRKSLDDRLEIYDLPDKNLTLPCYAPYADLQIRADGRITLCAIDWKPTVTFGDLNHERLEEILKTPVMQKTGAKLASGMRFTPVCAKCNRTVTGDACLKTNKYFKEGR